MEELFRTLLVRSPEAVDDVVLKKTINLSTKSHFQGSLFEASSKREVKAKIKSYIDGNDLIKSSTNIKFGSLMISIKKYYEEQQVFESVNLLDILKKTSEIMSSSHMITKDLPAETTVASLKNWIKEILEDILEKDTISILKDSIVALYYSQHTKNIDELSAMLSVVNFIDILLTIESTEETINPLQILNSTMILPKFEEDKNDYLDQLNEESLSQDRYPSENEKKDVLPVSKVADYLFDLPRSALTIEEKNEEKVLPTQEKDVFSKEVVYEQKIKLSDETIVNLPESIKKVLEKNNINYKCNAVDEMIKKLRMIQSLEVKDTKIEPKTYIINGTKITRVGTSNTQATTIMQSGNIPRGFLGNYDSVETPKHPMYPLFRPCIYTKTYGELMVIKQKLKRYEGGDVAHIENILKGEHKERIHRKKHTSEITSIFETEREESEEFETQTNTRYEMRSEVQKQIDEELSLEAGSKVSATYGTVSMDANAGVAYKSAKSEARQNMVSKAKDTVERAATSYSERVREELTKKVIEEVEETNTHGVDARESDEHIVGVYQWVNKVYEAQVYRYPVERTMYDIMIPEPAAYYIWSQYKKAQVDKMAIEVPPEFKHTNYNIDVEPEHIHIFNYQKLVAKFNATGVKAPPEEYVTIVVKKSFEGKGGESAQFVFADAQSVKIPIGYAYFTHNYKWSSVYGEYTYPMGHPHESYLKLLLSSAKDVGESIDKPDVSISVGGVAKAGEVPVTIHFIRGFGYTYFVQIICKITIEEMQKWQLETWDALKQGYDSMVEEYEEKLSNNSLHNGFEIKGRNPEANKKIERTELKKACIIALMDKCDYPALPTIVPNDDIGPYPLMCNAQIKGKYVRFFEQAFEWENMTYIYYPYFWARTMFAAPHFIVEDEDPSFQDFLSAGFARAVVPVRPGFKDAVETFYNTGYIKSPNSETKITDSDYLPIVEELKSALGAPQREDPIGEPWDVIVPTKLVKLRKDNALPEWVKDEETGEWTEVGS